MPLNWQQGIDFLNKHQQENPDHEYIQLLWKKLELGHRTQDMLMDIEAMKAIKDNGISSSPEWTQAMKWLEWQRAQQSNLMLDMIAKQLESGDRTPELLNLIRQAANSPVKPVAPVISIPEPPPPPPDVPPTTNF